MFEFLGRALKPAGAVSWPYEMSSEKNELFQWMQKILQKEIILPSEITFLTENYFFRRDLYVGE